MLLPQNFEIKIGFDKIKNLLYDECLSQLGRNFVDKIRFSDKFETIEKNLGQTFEFKSIIEVEKEFPNKNYIDFSDILKKLNVEGYFLEEEEFFELKLALSTVNQIFIFFKKLEPNIYPKLQSLYEQAVPLERDWSFLLANIESVIDDKGKVKDSASTELQNIRRKLKSEIQQVQRTLDRIYRTAKNSGWIGDEMSLTVRNGRLVLPILAEHKRKFAGFVHDESASGQIAYVEPGEVLEANNEIRDLEIRERREIVKILIDLTASIRPQQSELERSNTFLGLMDFIRAKAKLSLKINAVLPVLSPKPILKWQQAVHPILFLSHKKLNKPTIPLSVSLDNVKRILVVSGPNAGGKSVMLKTIGLLQYMLQCGLLVPISADATMGIFKSIFIDIGDEQSIENDLSTYSSHLTAMKGFLKSADKDSLFLIDEFGSGTEPSLGGAIAEAILEELMVSNALGVVNTHYTNLKVMADKNQSLVNGAMKFDAVALEPLFELSAGQPGSSFAFEVAQKIGLPNGIIRSAKLKIDQSQLNFEELLRDLEFQKTIYQDKNDFLDREVKELKAKMDQYKALKTFLDQEQKRILNQAKADAKNLIADANKRIESTIKDIKEQKADKETTKDLRKELQVFIAEKLKPEVQLIEKIKYEIDDSVIVKGDLVRLVGQETYGQVLHINGKDIEVMFGELKSNIKLNRLEKVSKKSFKEAQKEKVRPVSKGVDFNDKMTHFSLNLDLRGKRGEEAIVEVNRFIDDAIMLGYPSVRIIHGKGDGILRNLVRTHLRSFTQIKRISDEHADRGGQGISIVDMK